MRFPAIFEPRIPLRTGQAVVRAPVQQVLAPVAEGEPHDVAANPVSEPPDDLDQRVRQTGEWQLEDW